MGLHTCLQSQLSQYRQTHHTRKKLIYEQLKNEFEYPNS